MIKTIEYNTMYIKLSVNETADKVKKRAQLKLIFIDFIKMKYDYYEKRKKEINT